jgi:Flp pilus assembly protein CpaB
VRRSNVLVFAGIAFFVVGVIIVALLSRDDSGASASPSGTVDVLVAKGDIAAGTNGDDATTMVEVRRVSSSDRQADALVTPSQLSNSIFTSKFSKNEQIRAGGLKARSLTANVAVPEGKEAVAVSVPFVNGGAGYLSPGDMVNVYQVIAAPVQGEQPPFAAPRTQLVLTNVKVLDVQQQVAALNTSTAAAQAGVAARPSSASSEMTVLLAVDSIDAEKVIFGIETDGVSLYLTRVADKAAPAGPTPGRDFGNILEESPVDANARDHS